LTQSLSSSSQIGTPIGRLVLVRYATRPLNPGCIFGFPNWFQSDPAGVAPDYQIRLQQFGLLDKAMAILAGVG
jgi:hypothetical protein